MLRIIIIEDEIHILETIKNIISGYCPNVSIEGCASSVIDAVELLSKVLPDLVIMDINLPDGSAFDLLEKSPFTNFKIIFITAFEEYAIKAIKLSAIDYLVKPLDPKDLVDAINKAEKIVDAENNSLRLQALMSNLKDFSDKLKKIVIKTFDNIYLLETTEIVRCESDGSYTTFYIRDGRKIIVSKVLKHYIDMLEEYGFLHVHKSHLVNLAYLDHFIKRDGGFLVLKDGSEIPVSQRKKDRLLQVFDKLSL